MKNNLQNSKRKNAGFTLLELVVVIGVMGLMSTMAMDLYTDKSNQKRFELTKQRLAEIKFAIIGDPMMRVGSQAVLTGFFNDMERLPKDISELLLDDAGFYCLHDTDYSIDISKTNVDCPAGWSWTRDSTRGKTWNGPYLTNIQPNDNNLVFRDGWGNSGGGNFGWAFYSDFSITSPPAPGDLSIQSLGLDRITSTGLDNMYENDYPSAGNLINKVDLDRIMQLKALVASAGYCVILAAGTVDLNFVTQPLCDANNPAAPADPTHLWARFI